MSAEEAVFSAEAVNHPWWDDPAVGLNARNYSTVDMPMCKLRLLRCDVLKRELVLRGKWQVYAVVALRRLVGCQV